MEKITFTKRRTIEIGGAICGCYYKGGGGWYAASCDASDPHASHFSHTLRADTLRGLRQIVSDFYKKHQPYFL